MYRAASGGRRFPNIDLSPRRPKYSHAILLIIFPQPSQECPRSRVSAGRGVRGDPLDEARDCTLRRYGGMLPITHELWSSRIFRSLTE
jgi:hypothetical protein